VAKTTLPQVRPIAEALCDRPSTQSRLASALDDPDYVWRRDSWAWAQQPVATVRLWLHEEECSDAKRHEHDRFLQRADALRRLDQQLRRIDAQFQAVRPLLGPPPAFVEVEWPLSCEPCAELRTTVQQMFLAVRDRALAPMTDRIGTQLRWAEDSEGLVPTICAARTRARNQVSELRERFGYFTWTRTGVNVLALIDALQRTTADASCR
jgi:hypothetical protein